MRVPVAFRLITVVAVSATLLGLGVASASTRGGDHKSKAQRGHNGGCDKQRLARNKRNVVGFYTTAFNAGQPRQAVAKYVGPVYIQHNPFAADGADAFIAFVEGFKTANPQLNVDIKRVIAECNLVVTHSNIKTSPEVRGDAVMDIFRIDKRGKIVEHWDVVQPVPATSANDNTMF